MLTYDNKNVPFYECLGCAYGKHLFSLSCGMAYENDRFTLSQDFELPIVGFFVVSLKRHVEKLSDMTKDERDEMFDIVDHTIKILKKENVCKNFNVIFEEKDNRHLHVWIMPRCDWMKEIVHNPTDEIDKVFKYAQENFKNIDVYNKIDEVTKIVRKGFEDFYE